MNPSALKNKNGGVALRCQKSVFRVICVVLMEKKADNTEFIGPFPSGVPK